MTLGEVRHFSDVDVAIESNDLLPPRLLSELRESLEENEVDVVDLGEASPEFRERVKREGVLRKERFPLRSPAPRQSTAAGLSSAPPCRGRACTLSRPT